MRSAYCALRARPILHLRELRLFRYRQRLANLVDDHDQNLGGFGIARIAGHRMELARRLIEGLALHQDGLGSAVDLDLVGALQHVAEIMRARMTMRGRTAARG